MTLDEFIADVKAGRVMTLGGGVRDGKMFSAPVPLEISDVPGVTAEAFSRGVFQSTTRWPDALEQTRRALGVRKQGDLFDGIPNAG